MSKKPIILHIGVMKTGTTSLQAFLDAHRAELADHGFCYPVASCGKAGMTAHHNLFYELKGVDIPQISFDKALGGWKEALAEIDSSDCKTGLLSSEAFQYVTYGQVEEVAERLDGRDVTIVAYLRRQDRWLQSMWNQQARFGRANLDILEYVRTEGAELADYSRLMKPWIELFGDENVDIRIYDRIAKEPGIIADFGAAHLDGFGANVKHAMGEQRNNKAGIKQLVAVAKISAKVKKELGDDYVPSAKSAGRVSRFFHERKDDYSSSTLSQDGAKWILKHFKASEKQLAKMSTSFRKSGQFSKLSKKEYDDSIDKTNLNESLLDNEEQNFVERMASEIIRATKKK